MKYSQVLVIGSIGKIQAFYTNQNKGDLEDLNLSSFETAEYLGGTGLTIAATLRKLSSIPVKIWTLLGYDSTLYQRVLATLQIELASEIFQDIKTADGRVINFNRGEQQWLDFGSSVESLDPEINLDNIDSANTLAILSPIYFKTFVKLQKEVIARGIDYIYDAGMLVHLLSDEEVREGIENAKIVVANESEWRLIESRLGINPEMTSANGKPCIRTLSNRGTEVFINGENQFIKSFPTESIDATGAGDNWRGAFLASILSGESFHRAVEIANAVASMSVEYKATFDFPLDQSELNRRLEFIREDSELKFK